MKEYVQYRPGTEVSKLNTHKQCNKRAVQVTLLHVLSDSTVHPVMVTDLPFPRSIEYGENKEGYWTSERFMAQITVAVQIAEINYPRDQGYRIVWIFDHSSCHGAYAEDLLAGADRYRYMDDLLLLDACRPSAPVRLPCGLSGVDTPLDWREWDRCLASHPDQQFRAYIVAGIRDGFRVGFDYSRPCRHSLRNMPSATEKPQVITEYLANECAEG